MNWNFLTAGILGAAVFLNANPAFAYIDPGTGSILLQGIIGGAATFLVVLRLYGAMLKRKILSILGFESRGDEGEDAGASAKSAE